MGSPAPPPPEGVLRHLSLAPVVVAELAEEQLVDDPPEIPWHITPPTGSIAMQLRTTVRRVAIGAGLARDAALVAAVRALPDVPAVVTSPAGGTFIVGGPAWLGVCAIGSPARGQPMPLDWMLHSLHRWFDAGLQPWGVQTTVGRVEGAWCPGFSDLAVGGRKLVGLGFRVTRERVVMRGVMSVGAISRGDFDLLARCHQLIGVEIRRGAAISLSEACQRDVDVAEAITTLSRVRTVGAASR